MKRFFLNVLIAFFPLGMLIAIIETGMVMADYQPLGNLFNGRQHLLKPSPNRAVRYELRPGVSGKLWGSLIESNSYGFRDAEYPVEKQGQYRILVVGDSITFGVRIRDLFNTYPKRLEELMNQEGVEDYEVINLGLGGYDAVQAVSLLEYKGIQFKPDLVIYGMCVNDLGVVAANLRMIELLNSPLAGFLTRYRLGQFIVLRLSQLNFIYEDRLHYQKRVHHEFIEEQRLSIDDDRVLNGMMQELKSDYEENQKKSKLSGYIEWYTSETRVENFEYSLNKLKDLSEEHNFKVLVLLFPYLSSENSDLWKRVYDIIGHEAVKYGFYFLSLYDVYSQIGFEAIRWDVIHPNRRGHNVAAKTIKHHLLTDLILK